MEPESVATAAAAPEQEEQHIKPEEQNGDAAEQPAAVQPSQVSDEEVKQKLLVLLGSSDLTTTTGGWRGVVVGSFAVYCCPTPTHWAGSARNAEKMLRKQLEEELGVNLSSKKGLIRNEVGRDDCAAVSSRRACVCSAQLQSSKQFSPSA